MPTEPVFTKHTGARTEPQPNHRLVPTTAAFRDVSLAASVLFSQQLTAALRDCFHLHGKVSRSSHRSRPAPLRWRHQSTYTSDDHYVFASETMRGRQPYWPDNLMKRHIRPIAKANGINENIGWHTFRHSFGTLLKANGEDVKTVQELLRHANSRITLDVYTQAVNSNKRAAQSKVVRMIVSDVGQTVEEKYPQTRR